MPATYDLRARTEGAGVARPVTTVSSKGRKVNSTAELYGNLGLPLPAPRAVLRADNTEGEAPQQRSEQIADGVDRLFGPRKSYLEIKRERPEHRLMMWMTLQGQRADEIAVATGYTSNSVRNIQKQPWFQDAFCKLADEMGKDRVQSFLKGQVMEAIERTVELAQNADSDAVKLAANKEILDRFLGKAVVKAEVRSSGTLDINVMDSNALLQEQQRNAETLKARGIGNN